MESTAISVPRLDGWSCDPHRSRTRRRLTIRSTGMAEETTLRIDRIHHYRDTLRAYTVLADGKRLGRVMDERGETFLLSPGAYRIKLRLMWISSPTVLVELSAGENTSLICGPNGGILQAWRLFLRPGSAIFIEAADDEQDRHEPADEDEPGGHEPAAEDLPGGHEPSSEDEPGS